MKKTSLLALMLWASLMVFGGKPWKKSLTCKTEKIDLVFDLYEESILVPGMEMFGPMNGYMAGDIYGVWYVTGFDIQSDKKVILKVANDLGSENQKMLLTQQSDSTWLLQFQGHQVVKRVKGKKLVKIPSEMLFSAQ